jgi:outer membrane protein OmpA-like peptidoglycan-associated protein
MINSHTDDQGSHKYNHHLSQKRAESVVKYLVSKGISLERLHPKGYGETKPLMPNQNPDGSDNPFGRALNRRTEFLLLKENEKPVK